MMIHATCSSCYSLSIIKTTSSPSLSAKSVAPVRKKTVKKVYVGAPRGNSWSNADARRVSLREVLEKWGLWTRPGTLTLHDWVVFRRQIFISIRRNQRNKLSQLPVNLHVITKGSPQKIKPFQISRRTIDWKSVKCINKDDSYEQNC